MSIFINRSGIRLQYREQLGDERIDRQLRKAHLRESAETFIKKAAYMDAHLERNSEMMMQLGIGDVDITVQRVSSQVTNKYWKRIPTATRHCKKL